jgi:hypothetical protein
VVLLATAGSSECAVAAVGASVCDGVVATSSEQTEGDILIPLPLLSEKILSGDLSGDLRTYYCVQRVCT